MISQPSETTLAQPTLARCAGTFGTLFAAHIAYFRVHSLAVLTYFSRSLL